MMTCPVALLDGLVCVIKSVFR